MTPVSVDIATHIVVSLIVAIGMWHFWGNKKPQTFFICCIFALTFGLLIDVDHLFDYFAVFGPAFSPTKFFFGNAFKTSGKFYVPFHGFEYVAVLALVAYFLKSKTMRLYFTVGAVAMFLHLWIDILFYGVPFEYYFITYRFFTNFKSPLHF